MLSRFFNTNIFYLSPPQFPARTLLQRAIWLQLKARLTKNKRVATRPLGSAPCSPKNCSERIDSEPQQALEPGHSQDFGPGYQVEDRLVHVRLGRVAGLQGMALRCSGSATSTIVYIGVETTCLSLRSSHHAQDKHGSQLQASGCDTTYFPPNYHQQQIQLVQNNTNPPSHSYLYASAFTCSN